MIILLFKTRTLISGTHICTHTISYMPSAHSEQFWAASAKRFIKTSKRTKPIISPCSVSLERFLWEPGIWISCVICIHGLSLAIPLNLQQALFSVRTGEEMRMRRLMCMCDRRRVVKQLKMYTTTSPHPFPSAHLSHSTTTCCLPSIQLHSLSAVSLASQTVLEWILKTDCITPVLPPNYWKPHTPNLILCKCSTRTLKQRECLF